MFIGLYCLHLCISLFLGFVLESVNKNKGGDGGVGGEGCIAAWGQKKSTFQNREAAALKASLYIVKKQNRKATFLLYRLPLRSLTVGCTLYTGQFLNVVFSVYSEGWRFFLHTSCSEVFVGTEDIMITGNESQLLGDGSWWELWCSALRQGLLDMMHLSHLNFPGWVNQPACGIRNSIWLCFSLFF